MAPQKNEKDKLFTSSDPAGSKILNKDEQNRTVYLDTNSRYAWEIRNWRN